jgi:hypothetical protein
VVSRISTVLILSYCNVDGQSIATQRLSKHVITQASCSLLGNEAIMGSLLSASRLLLCNEWCTRFNNKGGVICVVGAEVI